MTDIEYILQNVGYNSLMYNRYELYDEDSPLQATVLNFVSRSDSEMDRVFHKVQVSSRLKEVDEG